MALSPQDEIDVRAAEYVLGVLDTTELRAVEGEIVGDPMFAARVEAWAQRLYPMFDAGDAQVPAQHIWARIDAQLPANDVGVKAGSDIGALRRSLAIWRGVSAGALAAAAALVVTLIAYKPWVPAPVVVQAPAPVMVATLSGTAGPSAVAINYDPSSGRMILSPAALKVAGHDAQLWVIAEDGVPRSLGVMNALATSTTQVEPALRATMHSGVTLAVTIEPIGGSPTGQPTTTPIISGKITQI